MVLENPDLSTRSLTLDSDGTSVIQVPQPVLPSGQTNKASGAPLPLLTHTLITAILSFFCSLSALLVCQVLGDKDHLYVIYYYLELLGPAVMLLIIGRGRVHPPCTEAACRTSTYSCQHIACQPMDEDRDYICSTFAFLLHFLKKFNP